MMKITNRHLIFHPFQKRIIVFEIWFDFYLQQLDNLGYSMSMNWEQFTITVDELISNGLLKKEPSNEAKDTFTLDIQPLFNWHIKPYINPQIQYVFEQAFIAYYREIIQDYELMVNDENLKQQKLGWYFVRIDLENLKKITFLIIDEIDFYTCFYLLDEYYRLHEQHFERSQFLAEVYQNFNWEEPTIIPEVIENGTLLLLTYSDIIARENNFNRSLKLSEEALNFHQKYLKSSSNQNDLLGQIYMKIGNAWYDLEKYSESMKYYQKAERLILKGNDKVLQNSIYTNFGDVAFRLRHFDKSIFYYKKALSLPANDLGTKARLYHALANIEIEENRLTTGEEYLQTVLNWYKKLEDESGQANILNDLGSIYLHRHEYAKSLAFYKKALVAFIKLGDSYRIGGAFANLAIVSEGLRNDKESKEYFYKALQVYQEIDDQSRLSAIYLSLGATLTNLREFEEAERLFQKALIIYQSLEGDFGLAETYLNFSGNELARRNFSKSLKLIRKSIRIFENLKDEKGLAEANFNYGNILLNTEQYVAAKEQYKKVLTFFQKTQDRYNLALLYQNWGATERFEGNLQMSKSLAKKALLEYKRSNLIYHQAEIYHDLGGIAYDEEKWQIALQHFIKALSIFKEKESLHLQAECHFDIGKTLIMLEEKTKAKTHWQLAFKLFELLGDEFNKNLVVQELKNQK